MPKKLTKVCQHCDVEKELDGFYHNRTKDDFHNGICKECQLLVNKNNKS